MENNSVRFKNSSPFVILRYSEESLQCAIYIMTNKMNTVLYTGVTSGLQKRVWEHKEKLVPGFTKKYNINKLVYYDLTESIESAIAREKQIKGWTRAKKMALIEQINPEWKDLYDEL